MIREKMKQRNILVVLYLQVPDRINHALIVFVSILCLYLCR